MAEVHIEVKVGDVLAVQADVLALKYAQALHGGVDGVVAGAIGRAQRTVRLPEPWGFSLEASVPGIAASQILFVGVPPGGGFGYREIRTFAHKVLETLAVKAPQTKHVLLTVQGRRLGLDEIEAFGAEVGGLVDAVREGKIPEALQSITIVERNERRAKRLASTLVDLLRDRTITTGVPADGPAADKATEQLRTAGIDSDAKAHIFVAMPFDERLDDFYDLGISIAVNDAGFVCERVDQSSFTGDVMEWVKSRIKSASLVVADLTWANPNVYLEVGYAWGCGVKTVLLVQDTGDLKFDTKGQRCLVYKKITELKVKLSKELKDLRTGGFI